MKADVFGLRHHLQVFWPVVMAYAVYVVNHFIGAKFPSEDTLHDESMLLHIPTSLPDRNIPLMTDAAYGISISAMQRAVLATSGDIVATEGKLFTTQGARR